MSENAKTIPGIEPRQGSGDGSTAAPDDDFDDVFSRTTVLGKDDPAVNDPDERLQPGSVLRDRFLLQARVSGGSMGVVYKALDRRLAEVDGVEPYVAIKVLSPQLARSAPALRALQQEAAKGRCLAHPNIVRFIDLDRDDELYFIVMEWLPGQSLANALDDGTLQPDIDRALDIVRQVGTALDYAHRCGVVHADVKPGNIMLLPDGSVKLFDFGIARVRQQQGRPAGPGVAELRAATPAYSSMQVLTGEDPVPADDVFSLACLAYRLLAGHRVFGPRNAAEAAEAGMEPQRPQGLTDSQWKALRKGLAFARVTRFAAPRDFVDALLLPSVDSAEPVSLAIPEDAILDRLYQPRRARWPYALLALVVLSLAAIAVLRPDWRAAALAQVRPLAERVAAVVGSGETDPTGDGASGTEVPPAAASSPPEVPAPVPGEAVTGPSTTPAGDESADPAPSAGKLTGEAERPAPVSDSAATPVMTGDVVEEGPGDSAAAGEDTAADEPVRAPAPEPRAQSAEGAAIAAAEAGADRFSLVLSAPGAEPPVLEMTLVEDDGAADVELYRWFALAEPLLVRVDEVGFSGSRSPGEAGHYTLSGDGVIRFDAGQSSASMTIRPTSDGEREPDRQVTLLLRDYYSAESELGQLEVRLLDDDQRLYEANLAENSVSFVTSRVTVHERDPAVQIDVVRYNPDQSSLSVRFAVIGDSATEGEDFFVPGRRFVTFAPGQRNARLLIPLVQDTVAEGNESFDIVIDDSAAADNTNNRITVIIGDDDTPDR